MIALLSAVGSLLSFRVRMRTWGAHHMAPGLTKHPPRTTTSLLLVIAPYFDEWFIVQAVKELRPRKIRFLVDDGTRGEDIEVLHKKCGAADFKVALGYRR